MRTVLRVFAALLVLAAVGAAGFAWLVYADRSLPERQTNVNIPEGSRLSDIAALLRAQRIIKTQTVFSLYVRMRRLSGTIQAAEYSFAQHESLKGIVDTLSGEGHPPAVWLSVPEGFTARQIAQRLQDDRLVQVRAFMGVVKHTKLSIGNALSSNLEGFLFPDTYLVARPTTAQAVAGMMTAQFRKRLPVDYEASAKRLGLDVPQIITVASIIEREAKSDGERALMAGVYYNRLRMAMPLEVDATIEYALPLHKTQLSFKDLAVNSPYNTYTHIGLPPTAISNPGRKSIDAAFHPRKTDYLYYVYKGGGHHEFSRTLQEQQAAERRYLR